MSIDRANAEGGDGSDIGAYEADPNLRISRVAKVGGDIRVQFNTLLGRNYRVESEDAITGPWNMLSNVKTRPGVLRAAVEKLNTHIAARIRKTRIVRFLFHSASPVGTLCRCSLAVRCSTGFGGLSSPFA